nr:ORF4 [Torque teno virus]
MSWRPPSQNLLQREEAWYSAFLSSHSTFCGCTDPLLHITLIAGRLTNPVPVTRQPETPPNGLRGLPALPAPPEPPAPPPRPGDGTGEEDGAHGEGEGGRYAEEDLEELFAAAAEDDMRRIQKTPIRHSSPRAARKPRRRKLSFTQSTPKRARDKQLGRGAATKPRDPRKTTPPAPAAATTAATPRKGNQAPPRRCPPTPKRSPLGPGPYIAPPEPIPDLLFPSTKKKKKFSKLDWENEAQIAGWLDRPMRLYPGDPPFYPWLPRKPPTQPTCRVSFKIKLDD